MSSAVADRLTEWAREAPAPSKEVMERPHIDEQVQDVNVTEERITFLLRDGRIVSIPLSWSWRLADASPGERRNYEVVPFGVHGPDVDEDLSGRGALRGTPAPRPGIREQHEQRRETAAGRWSPGAIKQLRRHMELTQVKFGDHMGVRQATVSDW